MSDYMNWLFGKEEKGEEKEEKKLEDLTLKDIEGEKYDVIDVDSKWYKKKKKRRMKEILFPSIIENKRNMNPSEIMDNYINDLKVYLARNNANLPYRFKKIDDYDLKNFSDALLKKMDSENNEIKEAAEEVIVSYPIIEENLDVIKKLIIENNSDGEVSKEFNKKMLNSLEYITNESLIHNVAKNELSDGFLIKKDKDSVEFDKSYINVDDLEVCKEIKRENDELEEDFIKRKRINNQLCNDLIKEFNIDGKYIVNQKRFATDLLLSPLYKIDKIGRNVELLDKMIGESFTNSLNEDELKKLDEIKDLEKITDDIIECSILSHYNERLEIIDDIIENELEEYFPEYELLKNKFGENKKWETLPDEIRYPSKEIREKSDELLKKIKDIQEELTEVSQVSNLYLYAYSEEDRKKKRELVKRKEKLQKEKNIIMKELNDFNDKVKKKVESYTFDKFNDYKDRRDDYIKERRKALKDQFMYNLESKSTTKLSDYNTYDLLIDDGKKLKELDFGLINADVGSYRSTDKCMLLGKKKYIDELNAGLSTKEVRNLDEKVNNSVTDVYFDALLDFANDPVVLLQPSYNKKDLLLFEIKNLKDRGYIEEGGKLKHPKIDSDYKSMKINSIDKWKKDVGIPIPKREVDRKQYNPTNISIKVGGLDFDVYKTTKKGTIGRVVGKIDRKGQVFKSLTAKQFEDYEKKKNLRNIRQGKKKKKKR